MKLIYRIQGRVEEILLHGIYHADKLQRFGIVGVLFAVIDELLRARSTAVARYKIVGIDRLARHAESREDQRRCRAYPVLTHGAVIQQRAFLMAQEYLKEFPVMLHRVLDRHHDRIQRTHLRCAVRIACHEPLRHFHRALRLLVLGLGLIASYALGFIFKYRADYVLCAFEQSIRLLHALGCGSKVNNGAQSGVFEICHIVIVKAREHSAADKPAVFECSAVLCFDSAEVARVRRAAQYYLWLVHHISSIP